jgi:hypothetical protein
VEAFGTNNDNGIKNNAGAGVIDAPAAPPPPSTEDALSAFLDGTENEKDDHHLVKKTLCFVLSTSSCHNHGCMLIGVLDSLGCTWLSGQLFPWKSLPSKLASSSVIVHGWPDGVLSLGDEQTMNSSGKAPRPKGISDLTLTESTKIMAAFHDPGTHRLHFECRVGLKGMFIIGNLCMLTHKPHKLTSRQTKFLLSMAPLPLPSLQHYVQKGRSPMVRMTT